MSNKLNLTPNEIVGYRIHPDAWNWKVVVVKRHGEDSKNSGQEYETTLAYCKDIRTAITYIVTYVSRMEGDKEQKITFDRDGVAADLEALKVAFEKAENAALGAVADLEARLKDTGIDLNALNKNIFTKEDVEAED